MEVVALLAWVLAFGGLAALAYPATAALFREFPLRGAGFALPVALATLALSSYWAGRIAFGLESFLVGLVVLGVASGVALRRGVEVDRRAYAEAMGVFLVAFLLLVGVRALDPAVHPGGGEKFLDFGLLNTLWRTGRLPPEDMWFAGEPVKYYYGGHMIAALLAKATGTPPRIAYNLALPGFFGVLVTAAYALGGALGDAYDANRRSAAVLSALLVGAASNLLTPIRLLGWLASLVGLNPAPVLRAVGVAPGWAAGGLRGFTYWEASRVVEGTITEFPFFGFVNGDLHAHMMSTGFTLLLAGVLYSYWTTPEEQVWRRRALVFVVVPALGGVIAVVNLWSFPTVVGLTWLATLFAPAPPWTLFPLPDRLAGGSRPATDGGPSSGESAADGGRAPGVEAPGGSDPPDGTAGASPDGEVNEGPTIDLPVDPGEEVARTATAVVVAGLVGVLTAAAVAPFFATATGDRWLALVENTSGFRELLVVHGGFLAVTVPYLAVHADPADREERIMLLGLVLVVAVLLGAAPFVPVAWGIFAPLLVAAWLLLRVDADLGFETVLAVGAFGLILLVEVVYVTGADRFNTVFKFYEQVWILWGTAAGAMLARHADPLPALRALAGEQPSGVDADSGAGAGSDASPAGSGSAGGGPPVGAPDAVPDRRAVLRGTIATVLVGATLVYPGFALVEHAWASSGPATLDATGFVDRRHAAEADAIEWVRDLEGQPTLVSAPTEHLYEWTTDEQLREGEVDRVVGASAPSSLTGVPTVVGWYVETYYRGDEPVAKRVADIRTIYDSGAPPAERVEALRRYDVEYVYVGPAERDRYGAVDFRGLSGVEVAYEDEQVTIYRVDRDELGVAG